MSFTQALSFVRSFTKFSNDYTFLSSLQSIDFVNHRVNVRSGYWKRLISFVRNHFQVQDTDFGRLCYIFKQIFIDRLSSVSANSLKKFFLGKIYRSYFNFSNLVEYTFVIFQKDIKKRLKNVEKLRVSRYFEKKAKAYYTYSLRNQISEETQHIATPTNLVIDDNQSTDNDSSDEHITNEIDYFSISSEDELSEVSYDGISDKRARYQEAQQLYTNNLGTESEQLHYRRLCSLRYIYLSQVKADNAFHRELTSATVPYNPLSARFNVISTTYEPVFGEFGVVDHVNVYENDIRTSSIDTSDIAGLDESNVFDRFQASTSTRPDNNFYPNNS